MTVARDYETPDDYADRMAEREANDDWCELQRDADKEEALVRRWEERREAGPYEDAPEPEETLYEYAAWLRREEYGHQDDHASGEVD